MKRFLALCLALALALCAWPVTAFAAPEWPDGVSIQADGGIVMEAGTGTILYGKNMDQPYYPASITKILTALIVIESCDLDEIVTFSHDAVYNVEADSSSAGIDEGDKLTVRDCLYALLLASANESANALAEHVSGTREAFADLMNQRAASLGCTGSHFANPSGLNDENHYTTAHDMALITRAAIQNPTFVEICGSRTYRLPNIKRAPVEKFPNGYPIANHHKMWNRNDAAYYNGVFCGKTGYTSLAGNTLVTCAKRGDMTLIAVILNGHLTHYADTKILLDFGFGNFQSLKIADFETTYTSIVNDMTISGMTSRDGISLELDDSSRVVIPKSAGFSDVSAQPSYDLDRSAPEGAAVQVNYTYNGRPVGHSYLMLSGGEQNPSATGTQADSTGVKAASEENSPGPSVSPSGNADGGSAANVSESSGAPGGQAGGGTSGAPGGRQTKGSAKTPGAPEDGSTATSFKLPSNTAAILGIAASLAVIVTIIIAVKLYVRRKEEARARLRRQRRIKRLEDIGCSSAEFDQIMDQYRSSTTSSYTPRQRRSRRRRFPFWRR